MNYSSATTACAKCFGLYEVMEKYAIPDIGSLEALAITEGNSDMRRNTKDVFIIEPMGLVSVTIQNQPA